MKQQYRTYKKTNQKIIDDKQKFKANSKKVIKKLEDDRDIYYRLNERAKDAYFRLQGLNVKRLHTVIENNKLKEEAQSSEELLQHTLNANQVLQEENDLLKKEV